MNYNNLSLDTALSREFSKMGVTVKGLTLFLVIYDWRSRTSLAPAWITILLNLRLALASTFKFAKMSGALAPGKQWTMVAGVSIFTFRTIESPITRALSPGFSVGASLSGGEPV